MKARKQCGTGLHIRNVSSEVDEIQAMLDAILDRRTFLHGDYNAKNTRRRNRGEKIIMNKRRSAFVINVLLLLWYALSMFGVRIGERYLVEGAFKDKCVIWEETGIMKLETERLILRRWEESDAENLYKYASDPDVGPIAGWPVHKSIDESRDVIKNVFNGKEAYAICLKEDGKAIGAIELKLNGATDMTERDDECELGYWLGKPYWNQGIVTEAAREMLRHAFEDCGMKKVWCGYYEGNVKSKRVQEKCGFKYQRTTQGVDVPLMHEKRTGHVNLMTKEDWAEKNWTDQRNWKNTVYDGRMARYQ